MYARVVSGVIQEGPQPLLPSAARRLDTQEWVSFIPDTPVAMVESTGWFVVAEVPMPAITATQRAELGYGVSNGRPTQTWTVRNETTDETTQRVRAANRQTLSNRTTAATRLTELREMMADADVAAFLAANNNTAFGAADRRALKTVVRHVDRLIKLVERMERRHLGDSLLDDISNT